MASIFTVNPNNTSPENQGGYKFNTKNLAVSPGKWWYKFLPRGGIFLKQGMLQSNDSLRERLN